mmetsp:Transcript_38278/g.42332  ORF Transcript_38278/g.42332 Transcript_38278/m.42332 type:complete len:263 (+) Transcript_38278:396-1184(+)
MSGPTIFAIVYSSVTIWTAVFSKILLGRRMNGWQWLNVVIVFVGLAITATDSGGAGSNILNGTCFIIVGSAMHGLTYVMSEAVMTVGGEEERLTVLQNNFVQASVAASLFLVWQLLYTLPHFNESIYEPMQVANTAVWYALLLLGGFGLSNVVHAITFFHTLKHFPGGATSAGVMKGLQAVFVFVLTNLLYCHRLGGNKMYFSTSKLISLLTVSGGVLGYGYSTTIQTTTTKIDDRKNNTDKGRQQHKNCNENTELLPAASR